MGARQGTDAALAPGLRKNRPMTALIIYFIAGSNFGAWLQRTANERRWLR